MVFSCCVITCRQKGGVKMHTFPYSIPELYNEWLNRIQRVDLFDMEPKRVATNYRICEKHFSDFAKIGDQCRSRTGLKKFALPNLHLPGFKEIPTKENSLFPKNLIMDKIPGRVTDKINCRESYLSTLKTQALREKEIIHNKQTFNKSNEIKPSRESLSDLIATSQEETKVKDDLNSSNSFTMNNSEMFDDNNVSGHNLPDRQDNSIKENSVLSSTMAVEELSSCTDNAEHIFNTNETFDTSLPISQLPGFVEESSKKKSSVSLSDVTMEELFANNPELFFDLNLPFDTNLPEIATFGFQEIDRTDSNNLSLENLKRKAPLLNEELRTRKRCK